MNADKILAAAKMYNKVVEKMLECESVNTANNYETDNLLCNARVVRITPTRWAILCPTILTVSFTHVRVWRKRLRSTQSYALRQDARQTIFTQVIKMEEET